MTSINDGTDRPRSILITGASGGVGRALVDRFAAQGWRVFAGVRSISSAPPLAERRPAVYPIELDLLDDASVARAGRQLHDTLHETGLDALVNNAGLSADGPVELLPIADLREAFAVNVFGAVAVTQAVLPLLRQARGRIVNMGGAAGRVPMPMYGALSASKAALDSISDVLRMELRHQGVAVTYIEPGALATDFLNRSAGVRAERGYAGEPAATAIYSEAIRRVGETLAAAKPAPLDPTLRTIERALTARTPAARYVVGREAKTLTGVVRRLPTSTRHRVVLRALHLDAAAFATGTSSARA